MNNQITEFYAGVSHFLMIVTEHLCLQMTYSYIQSHQDKFNHYASLSLSIHNHAQKADQG